MYGQEALSGDSMYRKRLKGKNRGINFQKYLISSILEIYCLQFLAQL